MNRLYATEINGKLIRLEIIERPDVVEVKLHASPMLSRKDFPAVTEWGLKFLKKYDSDPRPLQSVDPMTGDIATTYGDETHSIGVVKFGNSSVN